MSILLPYNPGLLPNKPAPKPGESILIEVAGLPPVKDIKLSIRNKKHKFHQRFTSLRNSATKAMDGRAWTFDEVDINLVIRSPEKPTIQGHSEFLGGIFDTLDGSSGFTFTYLPIVFEDNSQVSSCNLNWERSYESSYSVHIIFK